MNATRWPGAHSEPHFVTIHRRFKGKKCQKVTGKGKSERGAYIFSPIEFVMNGRSKSDAPGENKPQTTSWRLPPTNDRTVARNSFQFRGENRLPIV